MSSVFQRRARNVETDRLWKKERRQVHTDGRETDGHRQTGSCLPVGQAPWAPCLGEGSFSALILPCWGDLCEKMSNLGAVRSRVKTPMLRTTPPCLPLYLVVVWDPWNWAAMAVSQELLLEAERHKRYSPSHYLQR